MRRLRLAIQHSGSINRVEGESRCADARSLRGCRHRVLEHGDRLWNVVGAEDARPGDDDVRPGRRRRLDRRGSEAAVHLDVDLRVPLAERLDLGHHPRLELLPAKPGLHRHDEHHVNKARVADGVDSLRGGSGLERHANLHARRAGPIAQHGGGFVHLDVEGEHMSPGVLEGLDVVPGVGHHQVAVEESVGVLGEALHHRGAEGEVRDEVSVHDVQVEPVRAAVDDLHGLVRHAGEVGSEKGGGYDRRGRHG
mmetsp:Transcript_15097/g.63516  ORF Transcript_15097/g.63516 Transcript_15097/m.63516 type:complete len:252 (-) Transcript_15097:8-763(-)